MIVTTQTGEPLLLGIYSALIISEGALSRVTRRDVIVIILQLTGRYHPSRQFSIILNGQRCVECSARAELSLVRKRMTLRRPKKGQIPNQPQLEVLSICNNVCVS